MTNSKCLQVLCLLTLFLVGGEAYFENYKSNIITNGTYFFSVYADPGPQNWPYRFYTTHIDLTNWIRNGPPLYYGGFSPEWAEPIGYDNFELNVIQPNFIVYFDVAVNSTERRAIGVTWSNELLNWTLPWQSDTKPLIADINKSYVEPSLLLSSFPSVPPIILCRDSEFNLVATDLRKDGLVTLAESKTVLKPSLDWEEGEMTHPWALHKDGLVYLMYLTRSGKVGVARSRHPLGPYEKNPQPVGTFDLSKKKAFKHLAQQQLVWDEHGWPHFHL